MSGENRVAKRDRLGKGLGALLGEYLEADEVEGTRVRDIRLAAISPNPYQPRREFSEDELAELSTSIRENGLLQPIVVRPAPDEGDSRWQLVAGERRWRAVTRLGWEEIPAIVRSIDDRTLLVLALVENLQRSELSALDEATGYRQLAEEFDLSQKQIAEAVGKNRSTVANSMRLLQLPAAVRRMLEESRLSAGHARALLGLESERRMNEIARRAAENGWNVRQVENEVKRVRSRGGSRTSPKPNRKGAARAAAERRLEEELQRVLGTEARIRRGKGTRGKIEIPFYSSEDFEQLFELLTERSASDIV